MRLQISERAKLRGVANTAVAVLWMAIATSAAVGQSLTHDSNDRLTETVYPDGKSKRFVYDKAGNLRQVLTTTSGAGGRGKLPHSGITETQCFQAGSNALVNCSIAEAIALSGDDKQDGMYTDVNPMSYSHVGSFSKEECVKDNVTGLMWEGKTASGARAGGNNYSNWGDGRSGDASAYVLAVNAQGLCGFNDWRLPAVDELQSIVDYGKPYTARPMINSTWFPNTISSYYWSSSPYGGSTDYAWFVDFNIGYVGNGFRDSPSYAVRLVRTSQ